MAAAAMSSVLDAGSATRPAGAPPRRLDGVRIALFLPTLGGGGAEKNTVHLAGLLAARGMGVDLVCANATGPHLKNVGRDVRLVDLHAPRVLASIPALVRYLRRERPQLLLAALDHANLAAIVANGAAGSPAKVMVGLRTTITPALRHARQRRSQLFPWLAHFLYPRAAAVIGVSADATQDYVAVCRLPTDNVHVIYNPVVTRKLLADAQAQPEHPWFAPGAPPVVLAVGRLTAAKDYATLLRAFERVRAQVDCRLLVLGEGELRGELEALVQELGLGGSVQMPGFAANPAAYMAHARLFVLSSIFEGLPTVLIEAMACGAPVVATDCPSGPREILDGGRYGPLVPPGDPAALADAMLAALAAPPARELVQARAALFAEDRITDEYLALFERVLGRTPNAEAGRG